MNAQSLQLFVAAVCCVVLCKGGIADWSPWGQVQSTTIPDSDLQAFYDNEDESHVCCECVPFYLCSDNNTILTYGIDVFDERIGHSNRVQNVETCPDFTKVCCRPPTAPPNCVVNGTITSSTVPLNPNISCDCVHWEFCPPEMRVSDGSTPTTFIGDNITLERHAKCPHHLQVCCAFDILISSTPSSTPDNSDCVCLNPWLCGEDGFVITDGFGLIDLRTSATAGPPCLPPRVCCRKPVDTVTSTTQRTTPQVVRTTQRTTPQVVRTTETPLIEDQSCNGVRNRNGISVRIAGFKQGESQFGEFPWAGMVLRTYFVGDIPVDAFVGGAILIHPNVMLTAAHKVANEDVSSLTIRVGEWDIETDFEPGAHQVRPVEKVLIHPKFNNKTLYHDVALLLLNEPVVLQQHIRSICLARSVEEVDPSACVVNGWGEDSFKSSNYQTVMKSVTLPLVPFRRCQALLRKTRLGRWFRLHPSFVCAGGEAGVDACSSDGGGPLACPALGSTTGEYLLVGITAWGIGCGEAGVPGVYASTMADNRWIMDEVERWFPAHPVTEEDYGYDYDADAKFGTAFASAGNLIPGSDGHIKMTTLKPNRCPSGSRHCSPGSSVPFRPKTHPTTTTTAASTTQEAATTVTATGDGFGHRTPSWHRRHQLWLDKLRRREERERMRRDQRERRREERERRRGH